MTVMHQRRLLDTAIAVLLTALLLPVSVGLLRDTTSWTIGCFVVGASALVGSVALRRATPVATFWAASAAMLLLTLSPPLPGGEPVVMVPLSLLYLVILYTVVAETAHTLLPLLVAAAGFVLVLVQTFFHGPGPVDRTAATAFLVAVVLAVSLSCALGAHRRTRRRYVESLEAQASQAEELRDHSVREGVARERERIAHEVHDVVAHSLAVVVTQSDAALMVIDQDPARARSMMEAVLRTGRQAMGEIRGALAALSGDQIDTAPVQSLADVSALVTSMRAAGLEVELLIDGELAVVEAEAARAAHRIVQEAVTNSLKHGGAHVRCVVRLTQLPGLLAVMVTDDGPGFTTGGDGHSGLGLIGMRERARQLGGDLVVASGPEGTTLTARLPIR